MNKKILDVCCGSKMFWFNKKHKNVIFGDNRQENHILCDGRKLRIAPDVRFDFTRIPFKAGIFKMVIFDPPHLKSLGEKSWMAKKYGILTLSWRKDIRQGFEECFRVLEAQGTLIFKWNETQIKTSEILKLAGREPLIGHISGKRATTHWITFMKVKIV